MLVTSLDGNQTHFFCILNDSIDNQAQSTKKAENLMIPYRSTNQPNNFLVGAFNPSEKY